MTTSWWVRVGLQVVLAGSVLSSVRAEDLSGVVTGSDGKPVARALISAIGTLTVPWSNVQTTSGADGSFSFKGLNPGPYRLCAQVLAGGYLNPCDWSPSPPTLMLVTGKSVTAFALPIEKGSIQKIRINDPSNVLGANKAAAPLLMGIRTPNGLFVSPVLTAQDANGSDHEITIPFDTPVQILVQGNQLKLAASDGTPVATGALPTIQQSSQVSTAPAPLVLQVSR